MNNARENSRKVAKKLGRISFLFPADSTDYADFFKIFSIFPHFNKRLFNTFFLISG